MEREFKNKHEKSTLRLFRDCDGFHFSDYFFEHCTFICSDQLNKSLPQDKVSNLDIFEQVTNATSKHPNFSVGI